MLSTCRERLAEPWCCESRQYPWGSRG